jgi:hypothetical protein
MSLMTSLKTELSEFAFCFFDKKSSEELALSKANI